jgi:nicotinamidase-related amidase
MSTIPALDPAHTALLVMDFQPVILALLPESDSEALLGRMERAIAAVRASGGTLAYVRVGFTEGDWAAIPRASKSFATSSPWKESPQPRPKADSAAAHPRWTAPGARK